MIVLEQIKNKEIRLLDREIKEHFYNSKRNFIRNKIAPGDNKSLWTAIKIAKNQSSNSIPNVLTLNNEQVSGHEVSEAFASFFNQKIVKLKQGIRINNAVHNVSRKLLVGDRFFFITVNIKILIGEIWLT